ncbi:hypothetical protein P3342_013169 [Pyrenophora teres f. teres]|nr:hypothetical protein P3342_013169 [Pyrenophora teres f. teres]
MPGDDVLKMLQLNDDISSLIDLLYPTGSLYLEFTKPPTSVLFSGDPCTCADDIRLLVPNATKATTLLSLHGIAYSGYACSRKELQAASIRAHGDAALDRAITIAMRATEYI